MFHLQDAMENTARLDKMKDKKKNKLLEKVQLDTERVAKFQLEKELVIHERKKIQEQLEQEKHFILNDFEKKKKMLNNQSISNFGTISIDGLDIFKSTTSTKPFLSQRITNPKDFPPIKSLQNKENNDNPDNNMTDRPANIPIKNAKSDSASDMSLMVDKNMFPFTKDAKVSNKEYQKNISQTTRNMSSNKSNEKVMSSKRVNYAGKESFQNQTADITKSNTKNRMNQKSKSCKFSYYINQLK